MVAGLSFALCSRTAFWIGLISVGASGLAKGRAADRQTAVVLGDGPIRSAGSRWKPDIVTAMRYSEMAMTSALGTVISRHFEVVDDRDELVGGVKHATRAQAHDLRDALAGHNGLGPLRVAAVTEHLVILREVCRA